MNAEQYMQRATAHQQAGQLADAERICRDVLGMEPHRADALQMLGRIEWKRGRRAEAAKLFRQSLVSDPMQAGSHRNLGLVLSEMGKWDEAIRALARSVELRPESAETFFDLGNAYYARGMGEQAVGAFRQAVALKPDFVDALYNLANTLQKTERWEEAIPIYQRAVELRPDFMQAHNNLGNALWRMGRLEEAIAAYRTALAMEPMKAEMHNNLGNIHYAKGDMDGAMKYYEEAIALRGDFAGAHWNISLVHLMRGEYERGWPLYEWRWKVPGLGLSVKIPGPVWDGSELNGRRILIHNEQGLGDVMQFSRYVPYVLERGGKIVFSCSMTLHRLLGGQWPIEEFVATGGKLPAYDVQCPLMSMPLVARTTLLTIPAHVPYIRADAKDSAKWRERVPRDGRRKIGLVWVGQRMPDPFRAASPAVLAPLGKVEGVWLCSLQLGEKADPALGLNLTDWTDELTDMGQTAALIDNLDLVITVDTAVAHLAGAMGKPTWVLLKLTPDWRWMRGREDSPWYPTMRLFRQERFGDWEAVVGRIVAALKES
jgi:tetratricopeptide (TPR) repeat protein